MTGFYEDNETLIDTFILGATGRVGNKSSDQRVSYFFKPIKAEWKSLGRVTSIPLLPVITSVLTVCYTLASIYQTLALAKLYVYDKASSDVLNEAKTTVYNSMKFALQCLIITILGPIVNAADLIGSLFTTAASCCKAPEPEGLVP